MKANSRDRSLYLNIVTNAILFILSVSSGLHAGEMVKKPLVGIFVDGMKDVSSSIDGTSWSTAFTTIMDGVRAAKAGQNIYIACGTYHENIDLTDVQGLTLLGGYLASDLYEKSAEELQKNGWTILDGKNRRGDLLKISGRAKDIHLDGFLFQNANPGAAISLNGTKKNFLENISITSSRFNMNGYSFFGEVITISNAKNINLVNLYATRNHGLSGGFIGVSHVNGLNISGGVWEYNQSLNGGALFVDNSAHIKISKVNIKNNAAQENGGGIFIQNSQDVQLADLNHMENISGRGGAIHIRSSRNVELSSNKFIGNRAIGIQGDIGSGYGGGVWISECQNVRLSGLKFERNSSFKKGGGLFVSSTESISLFRNTFLGNHAALAGGGAIFRSPTVLLFIDEVNFIENQAKHAGGIMIDGKNKTTNVVIRNSNFSNNQASRDGGAIFADNIASEVRLQSTSFMGNFSGRSANDLYLNANDQRARFIIGAGVTIIDHAWSITTGVSSIFARFDGENQNRIQKNGQLSLGSIY